MQPIELEAPYLHHRRKNTEPVFQEFDQAITELTAARTEWTPENDTRGRIRALADRVAELSADLAEVDDSDHELMTAEAIRNEFCVRLEATLKEIRFHAGQIVSDEEGVKPLRKRLTRALDDVAVYVKAFRSGTESRPQLTAAFESAKGFLAEFRVIAEQIDAWAPRMATEACDRALAQLREPLRTSPEPESEARPINPLRVKLSDALFELIDSMGLLSVNNAHVEGSLTERRAVIQRVRDLRRTFACDFAAELSDGEGTKLLEQLRSIQNDVARLRTLDGGTSGPLSRLISDTEPMMQRPLAKIRALLAPAMAQPATSSTKNLLGRIAESFGWGDEPEAA